MAQLRASSVCDQYLATDSPLLLAATTGSSSYYDNLYGYGLYGSGSILSGSLLTASSLTGTTGKKLSFMKAIL